MCGRGKSHVVNVSNSAKWLPIDRVQIPLAAERYFNEFFNRIDAGHVFDIVKKCWEFLRNYLDRNFMKSLISGDVNDCHIESDARGYEIKKDNKNAWLVFLTFCGQTNLQ